MDMTLWSEVFIFSYFKLIFMFNTFLTYTKDDNKQAQASACNFDTALKFCIK